MNSCSSRGGRGFQAQMRLIRRTDSKRLPVDNFSQKNWVSGISTSFFVCSEGCSRVIYIHVQIDREPAACNKGMPIGEPKSILLFVKM